MVAYRYSEWDGTQEIPPLDPDEVLDALSDDLMNLGDLQHALRNLLQRGMRNPLGPRLHAHPPPRPTGRRTARGECRGRPRRAPPRPRARARNRLR